ncbi:MAG TPA: PDZ domain-containing protein [Gemmatimonadales bacterium]
MRTAFCIIGAGLLTVAPLFGQTCPEGRPAYPSIGVQQFHCLGGSCQVNDRNGTGYSHTFSSEPRLRGIDPRGPSAGKLQEGDVLVSVDGALITSRDGGRRLGSLPAGRPATLRVRRDGRELTVEVTPVDGCAVPSLVVTSTATELIETVPAVLEATRALQTAQLAQAARVQTQSALQVTQGLRALTADTVPPVEFGIELSCGDCGWSGSGFWVVGGVTVGSGSSRSPEGRSLHRGGVFVTSEFPVVRAVEKDGPADAGGMQIGDVILTVAGMPITSRDAGAHLGQLKAGDHVEFEVRRGDRIVAITLTPRESREKRQRM